MCPMWEHRFFCSNVTGALRPVLVDETHQCPQGFLYDPTRGFSVEHLPPGPGFPKPEPGICQDCEAQRLLEEAQAEEEAARAAEEEAQAAANAAEAEALAAEQAHEQQLEQAFAEMQAVIPARGWVPPAQDDIPQEAQQPHAETAHDRLRYQDVWNRHGEEAADMWWNIRFRNR